MVSKEEKSEETRQEIMEATFRALCKHGYANLTMQKIANESNKSKSSLHYHYDTKENLIVEFIEYLLEGFREVMVPNKENPLDRLNGLIDRMLYGLEENEDPEKFHTALIELSSQAPYQKSIRDQISINDNEIHRIIAEIIEEGIDEEVFREVDPDVVASLIISTIDGGRLRQISTNQEASDEVRHSLDQFINSYLLLDH